MSPAKRYAKKPANTRPRRHRNTQERLERDRRQAQRAAEALHHTLAAWGWPATFSLKPLRQSPCSSFQKKTTI
jgi:hypothetical protein